MILNTYHPDVAFGIIAVAAVLLLMGLWRLRRRVEWYRNISAYRWGKLPRLYERKGRLFSSDRWLYGSEVTKRDRFTGTSHMPTKRWIAKYRGQYQKPEAQAPATLAPHDPRHNPLIDPTGGEVVQLRRVGE